MLEPYPDIAALKEYPTMVYHCILFLRMSDLPWENLLLPWLWQWLTMFSLHYGYIFDNEYGIYKHDHEIIIGNHVQLWKHGFHNSWVVRCHFIMFRMYTIRTSWNIISGKGNVVSVNGAGGSEPLRSRFRGRSPPKKIFRL